MVLGHCAVCPQPRFHLSIVDAHDVLLPVMVLFTPGLPILINPSIWRPDSDGAQWFALDVVVLFRGPQGHRFHVYCRYALNIDHILRYESDNLSEHVSSYEAFWR